MSTKKNELYPRKIYNLSEERVEKYLLNAQERYFEVVAENLELKQQVSRLINDQNRILNTLEKTLGHLSEQKENFQRLENQVQKLSTDLFQYLSLENKHGLASEKQEEVRFQLKMLFLDKVLNK